MTSRTVWFAFWLACAAVLALPSSALARRPAPQFHEDASYGYKLRPPKGWKQMPLPTNESWKVARFLADKAEFYNDELTGDTREFRSELLVIAFLARSDGPQVSRDDDGELVVRLKSPFEDYPDYLDQTYTGGGHHIADTGSEEIAGLDATTYDIRVEKGAGVPKRITTWVFATDEIDFAVQFETLEEGFDKKRKTLVAALRTFREIPRTAGLPTAATGEMVASLGELTAATPEARAKSRQKREKAFHERAKQNVPEDWEVQEIDRFLVLNHGSSKAGKRKVEECEAVLGWMDDTFPFIGPDEYVRTPVLRICKDFDEEQTFLRGSEAFSFQMDLEIVTYDDTSSNVQLIDTGLNIIPAKGRLYFRTAVIWLNDRDAQLTSQLPPWLNMGLVDAMHSAVVKRKKVSFEAPGHARERLREKGRNDELSTPRELMRMAHDDFVGRKKLDEAGELIRFFLNGKHKKTFQEYVKNLQAVAAEVAAEQHGAEDEAEPETEEEEEALFRKRMEQQRASERRLIDEAFARTFGEWSERDWKSFDKAYFKGLK